MILRRRKTGRSPCDDCRLNPVTGDLGTCPYLGQGIRQHRITSCDHYYPPNVSGSGTISIGEFPTELP